MCRVLKLHRRGFYAWLNQPLSQRAIEYERLLKLIKEAYVASGATYGSPWTHCGLLDAGERCGVHRVAKIMRENKLRAQIGYKRRYIKGSEKGKVAAINGLDGYTIPQENIRFGYQRPKL